MKGKTESLNGRESTSGLKSASPRSSRKGYDESCREEKNWGHPGRECEEEASVCRSCEGTFHVLSSFVKQSMEFSAIPWEMKLSMVAQYIQISVRKY